VIGLVFSAFVPLLLFVLVGMLTGGSIQGSTSIQIKGTTAPQGTASSSTLQPISTTVTGSAQESLTFGTGSGQCNVIIAQDRTLAISSSETLDINTGLADIFGATPTMLHLKYIAVYIASGGDVTGLTIEPGATDPFAGYGISTTLIVYPNGPGFQNGEPTVGIAVSSAVANIKIVNNSSSAAVTYRIVLGGTTT
jgi:hypothetical protein